MHYIKGFSWCLREKDVTANTQKQHMFTFRCQSPLVAVGIKTLVHQGKRKKSGDRRFIEPQNPQREDVGVDGCNNKTCDLNMRVRCSSHVSNQQSTFVYFNNEDKF